MPGVPDLEQPVKPVVPCLEKHRILSRNGIGLGLIIIDCGARSVLSLVVY